MLAGKASLPDLTSTPPSLLCRVLCGLGMGIDGTIHPVYVCELTSPALRGTSAVFY